MEQSGWTIAELAEALSISKGTVSKALALLRLPADIQDLVNDGSLGAAAAYEVSRLEGEEAQRVLARRILNEGLKRDDANREVGKAARPKGSRPKARQPVTSKTLVVGSATLTITWSRESITREEVIAVLREALDLVAGEAA
jgi:ParB family chromosome partitioning protein